MNNKVCECCNEIIWNKLPTAKYCKYCSQEITRVRERMRLTKSVILKNSNIKFTMYLHNFTVFNQTENKKNGNTKRRSTGVRAKANEKHIGTEKDTGGDRSKDRPRKR